MIHSAKENILQPHLNQACEEERTFGHPTKKTLLEIAKLLVAYAPNLYSKSWAPSYSVEEKNLAIQLLTKYGYKKLCNLSPRYKKVTLQAIEQELAREA
jgi:hypothetical protein